jgi:CDP-diacylglycerol--serine O-phosphatidyltransferase
MRSVRPLSQLPNLLTLANAGLGLLAISKAIDALAVGVAAPEFHGLMETACWLVLAAAVLDGLDGRLARLLQSQSSLGAQLDSFADAVTFGVAPAMVGKVMLEAHGLGHPRLNFVMAAAFSLMAILRLARFNVASEEIDDKDRSFTGLPSPAAAGTLVVTILMGLSLEGRIEGVGGQQATVVGRGLDLLSPEFRADAVEVLQISVLFLLPVIGMLMISRIRYVHGVQTLFRTSSTLQLARLVFVLLFLFLAPVPLLFVVGWGYVLHGVVVAGLERRRPNGDAEERRAA